MSFNYPISLPSVTGFRTSLVTPVDVVGFNQSPFTGQQQVYEWPGQWMQWSVSLPAMKDAAAGEWAAAFMSLKGRVGTFLLGPSVRKVPNGTGVGTLPGINPKISGGAQTGMELFTGEWPASTAQVLKAGDWLQIGGQNLLLRSQEFDNAAWVKTAVTVTANSIAAPDGTTTGDTLTPTSADSYISQALTLGRVGDCVFSVWLKAASTPFSLLVTCQNTGAILVSRLIAVTTTWQRFEFPFLVRGNGVHYCILGQGSTWGTGYAIYAWGAQVEQGTSAGGYNPTTTAAYSVGRRLHRVLADVDSDGYGNATIPIWPSLRESPANNAPLTLTSPKGVFRLTGAVPEGYDARKICDGMSFEAIEVLT